MSRASFKRLTVGAASTCALGLMLFGPAPALATESAPDPKEPTVRLLGQASLSAYDGSSWLGGGLFIEGRVAGAVWFIGGASVETRPKEQSTTSAGHLAVPTQVGFRRVALLPGKLALRGGGDFLLILEEALDEGATERTLTARPGGLLEMGLTLPLGQHLALDLAVSMGAVLRQQPSEVAGLPPLIGPAPRFQLRLGLRFNVAAKQP